MRHFPWSMSILLAALAGCSVITDTSDYMFVEDGELDAGKADAGDAGRDADAPTDGQAPRDAEAGTDAEADAEAGVPGISAQKLVEGLAALSCERVSRCESKRGAATLEVIAPPVCHPEAVQRKLVAPTVAMIEAGALTFDGAAAESCLEAVTAAQDQLRDDAWPDQDCRVDPIAWVWAQCQEALAPNLGTGDVCQDTRACEGARVCAGIEAVCGGHCVTPGDENDECAAHEECKGTLACVGGVCVPRGTSGDPCQSDRECVQTDSSDYFCNAGSCALRLVINSACTAGESMRCAGGEMLCTAPATAGSPVCRPPADAAAGDEACDDVRPCGPGLRCGAESTCVPVVGRLDPCSSDDQCAHGLYCEGGTCRPRPVVGDACSTEADAVPCFEGLCIGDVCALAPSGTACVFDPGALFATCKGYCAADGECANQEIIGRPCEADYQCPAPSLVCREAEDAGFQCLKPACLGQMCENDQQCPAPTFVCREQDGDAGLQCLEP